jgi:uncharacterized protein (DUF1015 family)
MAIIHPFRAIRPNPLYADTLVLSEMQIPEKFCGAKTGENLPLLKEMLESPARTRPETPEGQEQAYREINGMLQMLLQSGQLYQEKEPGIYVYEIAHPKYRQTGIWTLTALSDYTSGKIKIHELTFTDSVRRLRNYRQSTGLEGSPVLLTYSPSVAINRIIAKTRETVSKNTLGNRNCFHRLWKIDDPASISKLISAFADIKTVYLADGHHRLLSAAKLKAKQRDEGEVIFDSISSLYIATDQLRIQEFNRVVIPDETFNSELFLGEISKRFYIRKRNVNHSIQPKKEHLMGMYFQGEWFYLNVRNVPNDGIANSTDVSILQKQLLAPFFGITDPENDTRLKCVGGSKATEELDALLKAHPEAIAFTLSPITNQQLLAVSDAGEILPPKSTWIDPKVPYGLVIHKHLKT